MNHFLRILLALQLVGLVACTSVPTSIVLQPMSARPPQIAPVAPANGSIFQSAAYRPLFEDRRARLPGDLLTITISETTTAAKAGASSASKSGSVAFDMPKLFGVPAITTANAKMSSTSDNKFEGKDAQSASNNFAGTIAVTVIEVLSNGNLVVSGEKQIGLDKGAEFIRFSGTVSPDSITSGNLVSSTKVADARVEYRTNSQLDRAEVTSMVSRFFLSVLPL